MAIVTGSSRVLGRAFAHSLAAEHCHIVLCARGEDKLYGTKAELDKLGVKSLAVTADVTKPEDCERLIDETLGTFGRIDILVNNAGIARINNVEDTTSDEWDLVMDINAKGVFLGTKAAIPEIRKAGGGSIVNISAIAGLTGGRTSSYAASKGAVRLLTKS